MYQRQIKKINDSIKKNHKVIISLGCSFVQGQGAVNQELYTDYEWVFEKLGVPLSLNLSKQETKKLIAKYPDLLYTGPDDKIDFTFMEYENAFVNVLCKKYFNNEYTPINLGIRGCGNRATIKDLYFYPEIDWHNVDEIIVIFCPSGPERFDFANDGWNDHHHWRCMWPHYESQKENSPRRTLWEGYNRDLYSEKFEILEQIANVKELLTWCELKKARLIITPSFDTRYDRAHFKKSLSAAIARDMDGNVMESSTNVIFGPATDALKYLDYWPWGNMFYPDGHKTWVDFVIAQEFPNDYKYHHFFEFLGKGSPDLWITSCAHPSAKGHDAFAKKLFEFIVGV